MSVVEKIDAATLGWVKAELDQSISEIRSALNLFLKDPEERKALRNGAAQANQVEGTLHMVELYGAAMLAGEIKFTIEHLISNAGDEQALASAVSQGLNALGHHLDDLSLGGVDLPMRLLSETNALRAARDVSPVKPLELFSPDLSTQPPARQNRVALSDADYRDETSRLHRHYQVSLLKYLNDPANDAPLVELYEIMESLMEVTRFGVVSQLWWVAAGFIESLRHGDIEATKERRILLARVDRELNRVAEQGESALVKKRPGELVKQLLFEIGQGTVTGERSQQVQTAFQLHLFFAPPSGDADLPDALRALAALADIADDHFDRARDTMTAYFDGHSRSPDALSALAEELKVLHGLAEEANAEYAVRVYKTLGSMCDKLIDSEINPSDRLALSAIDALRTIESVAFEQPPANPQWHIDLNHILDEINALTGDSGGVDSAEVVKSKPEGRELRQLLSTVADDLTDTLGTVESAVEAFAAERDVDVLKPAVEHIEKATSILDELGQGRAGEIMDLLRIAVRGLRAGRIETDDALLEALAFGVGVVQSHVDGLKGGQPIVGGILDRAAEELNDILGDERTSVINSRGLSDSLKHNFDAWLKQPQSSECFRAFRNDLRAAQALAEQYKEERLGQISDEMVNILDIVVDSPGAFSADVAETLTTSNASLLMQLRELPDEALDDLPMPEDDVQDEQAEHEAESVVDDEIFQIFVEESEQALELIDVRTAKWQQKLAVDDTLKEIRRGFHTLKGSGRLVGINAIGDVAWVLESLLNDAINGDLRPTPALVPLIQDARQAIEDAMACPDPKQVAIDIAPWEARAEAVRFSGDSDGEREELLEIFVADAGRHVDVIQRATSVSVDCVRGTQVWEDLELAVHTLAGNTLSVEMMPLASVMQVFEKLLEEIAHDNEPLNDNEASLATRCRTLIAACIDSAAKTGSIELPDDLIGGLDRLRGDLELECDARRASRVAVRQQQAIAGNELETPTETVGDESQDSEVMTAVEEVTIEEAAAEEADDYLDLDLDIDEDIPTLVADNELRDIYCDESVGVLERMQAVIAQIRLGQSSADPIGSGNAGGDLVRQYQRELHTLKGSSRTIGYGSIAELIHAAESRIASNPDELRKSSISLLALLEEMQDSLNISIACIQRGSALPQLSSLTERFKVMPMSEQDATTLADDETDTTQSGSKKEAAQQDAEPAEQDAAQAAASESTAAAASAAGVAAIAAAAAMVELDSDDADTTVDLPFEDAIVGDDEIELGDEIDEDIALLEDFDSDFTFDPPLLTEVVDVVDDSADAGGFTLSLAEEDAPSTDSIVADEFDLDDVDDASVVDGPLGIDREDIDGEDLAADDVPMLMPDDIEASADIPTREVEVMSPEASQIDLSSIEDVDLAEDSLNVDMVEEVGAPIEDDEDDVGIVEVDGEVASDGVTPAEPDGTPVAETAPAAREVVETSAASQAPTLERVMEESATVDTGATRVSIKDLDLLISQANELGIVRSRIQQSVTSSSEHLSEMKTSLSQFGEQLRELEIHTESQMQSQQPAAEESVEIEEFDPLEFDRFTKLQTLSRGLAERLNDLQLIHTSIEKANARATQMLNQHHHVATQLQDGLMHTRMVTVSTIESRLRHLVRQAARELGKQCHFVLKGGELEIDRNVIERVVAPFEHMLRNAIDHGIETPEARRRVGKEAAGTITLQCRQDDNHAVFILADDGAGLNVDAICDSALAKGLITQAERDSDEPPSDAQLMTMLASAGLTTSSEVTQLSGRGVGMDVVVDAVRQLDGEITLSTRAGQGTSFELRVPTRLAVAAAVTVTLGEQRFAIADQYVRGVLRMSRAELNDCVDAKTATFSHDGASVPLFPLAELLDLPPADESGQQCAVLQVRVGAIDQAIVVEHADEREEIAIRPLGKQLSAMIGMQSATITGSGQVALIVDLKALWDQYACDGRIAPRQRKVKRDNDKRKIPVVMVVDDSLTVRKITEKNLARHGIPTILARDGVEALERMRSGKLPDVILSDIEMPNMDGYELTREAKADAALADIPIIMITSRAGDRHREHAMEAGATDYMSKPYDTEDLVSRVKSLFKAAPA